MMVTAISDYLQDIMIPVVLIAGVVWVVVSPIIFVIWFFRPYHQFFTEHKRLRGVVFAGAFFFCMLGIGGSVTVALVGFWGVLTDAEFNIERFIEVGVVIGMAAAVFLAYVFSKYVKLREEKMGLITYYWQHQSDKEVLEAASDDPNNYDPQEYEIIRDVAIGRELVRGDSEADVFLANIERKIEALLREQWRQLSNEEVLRAATDDPNNYPWGLHKIIRDIAVGRGLVRGDSEVGEWVREYDEDENSKFDPLLSDELEDDEDDEGDEGKDN